MLIMSNMGDHVWLITSRQTEPELRRSAMKRFSPARASIQFINIWMENAIDEANAGAFVGVLVGKLHMNLPQATCEWRYG